MIMRGRMGKKWKELRRGCYHMLPPFHLHPLQLWICKWWQGFPILICVINVLKWIFSICGFRHNPNTSIIWQPTLFIKTFLQYVKVFFPEIQWIWAIVAAKLFFKFELKLFLSCQMLTTFLLTTFLLTVLL